LGNNNFTGSLGSNLAVQGWGISHALQAIGSHGMSRLELAGNNLEISDFPLLWVGLDYSFRKFYNSFWCPVYQDQNSLLQIDVDPQVWNYFGCNCSVGFFGIPSVACESCPRGESCEGDVMQLAKGHVPVISLGSAVVELTGTEMCPTVSQDACNPDGEYR
jgi:hypothetical protein